MKKILIMIFAILIFSMILFFANFELIEKIRAGKKDMEQTAMKCALVLYEQEIARGIELNSQCLGVCGGYAVDIVHVPRVNEDNILENQCSDYREGRVSKFIELDKNGDIVRIG